MTTCNNLFHNFEFLVVEAYRLDRYDNSNASTKQASFFVVEAYRLDRYDNSGVGTLKEHTQRCRSLSFG